MLEPGTLTELQILPTEDDGLCRKDFQTVDVQETGLDAHEYRHDDVVVLELKGRVDDFNTSVLADELTTIINTGRFRIAIDLRDTNFLSAHCLRAIWKAQRSARQHGGEIALTNAEGEVLETIHAVDFDRVVRRFYGIEECLDYLQKPVVVEEGKEAVDRPGFIERLLGIFFWYGLLLTLASVLPKPVFAQERATYTLPEVLDLAREVSPAVRLARLRLQEAQADLSVTQSYGLPRLLMTGGYMYQSNPSILGEIANRELNKVHNSKSAADIDRLQTSSQVRMENDVLIAGLGFTQVVYSGGLLTHQVSLQEAKLREAGAQVENESFRGEEEVRNLFIGLLLAQERIHLLTASRQASEKRLIAARNAIALRTMSAVQFAQLELQNLDVERQLFTAEKEERSLRGYLNITLGRELNAPLNPIPMEIDVDLELDTAEHYVDMALHRHPELRKAAAQMDSANAYREIVRVRRTFVPQALLFGSAEYSQGLGDNYRDLSWSLGCGFQMPIYDGGLAAAEINKALILASQARLAYESTEASLRVEVNNVVGEIRRAQLQHEVAIRTRAIARQQRAEANSAVAQGQLPGFRLDESITKELEANLAVIAAKAEFYRWNSRLMALTGRGGL